MAHVYLTPATTPDSSMHFMKMSITGDDYGCWLKSGYRLKPEGYTTAAEVTEKVFDKTLKGEVQEAIIAAFKTWQELDFDLRDAFEHVMS